MREDWQADNSRYGSRRLTFELTNICNLHCDYCLRDEDALYHSRAVFMSTDLLRQIISDVRDVAGITEVAFTGGEPTLHPDFAEIIRVCGREKLQASFVTNGWNFAKLWPELSPQRESLSHVAFSIDGTTAEAHDRWRGDGSFVRLIRAFSICRKSNFPFVVKIGIRRDTIEHLEEIAMFAARLGAAALAFAHIMPTSTEIESDSALSLEERSRAEEEIALLSRIFKMRIGIDVGYYNLDRQPPCSALAATSCNVDYEGRLTLCCNLSGFRGSQARADVIADLRAESFASAYERFLEVGRRQLELRNQALSQLEQAGLRPDLYTGSPCLFCLKTFAKLPWHDVNSESAPERRFLPLART
jgi:MoaA/NifB/PqqE/SkfB family radical SAM enzyme